MIIVFLAIAWLFSTSQAMAQNFVYTFKDGVSTNTTYPLPLYTDYYRDIWEGKRFNYPKQIAQLKQGPELGKCYQIYSKDSVDRVLACYKGWMSKYGWKLDSETKMQSGSTVFLRFSKNNEKSSIVLGAATAPYSPPDKKVNITYISLQYPVK